MLSCSRRINNDKSTLRLFWLSSSDPAIQQEILEWHIKKTHNYAGFLVALFAVLFAVALFQSYTTIFTLFALVRCGFSGLRFGGALLMLIGQRRKISIYTQFVPMLTFMTFFLQLILEEILKGKNYDVKDNPQQYRYTIVLMPCYFIFFSLAMN